MEMQAKLKEWSRKMGYTGPVPENLDSICNESTKFIWEQVVQNVRPKQEVEHIKSTIINYRLREKSLEEQGDFLYKLKEVEEYKKKLALEEKLAALKESVRNKQCKADRLAQVSKIKEISVDLLRKRIKENEQKWYLLEGKKKLLETQHSQIQETLREVKCETVKSCNKKSIRESLEHLVEKVSQQVKTSMHTNTEQNEIVYTTIKKKKRDPLNHSVANYLSLQEQRDNEEITRLCLTQGSKQKETRRALELPTINVITEGDEKNDSDEQLGVRPLSSNLTSEFRSPISKAASKPKKKESLGLLPNSFFEDDDRSDEVFLCSPNHDLPRNDCSSLVDNSILFNSKSQNVTKILKNDLLLDEKLIGATVRELLANNNRVLISEVLQQSFGNVVEEFSRGISVNEGSRKKLNAVDMCKLELIHVQTELNIIQQRRVLKELVVKIARKKLQLLSSAKSRENICAIQDWLEGTLKEVTIDATISAIKKQLNQCKLQLQEDEDTDTVVNIFKVKKRIEAKLLDIQQLINHLRNTHKTMEKTRRAVQNQIYQVQMLQYDVTWADPLLRGGIFSKEIATFEEFPMEAQRRCIHTDQNVYYKDICTDNYPQDPNLDDKDLKLLQDILESPLDAPEMVLLKLIKAKKKMNLLKSIRPTNHPFIKQYRAKYSYEGLQLQDSYLESALERLKSILYSSKADRTLAAAEATRQAMEVYMESPLKDFISEERLVDGKNFQFYHNKLKRFL
ncbi:uncharacterized protein LOC126742936 [Anthonomus grandis grandis]|uniref:uncharacterized protein LOC126742936 n=1 Tax=Anthonomus grandis grandis TaxID=2921223 RepID=UPI002165B8CD|nr:uncharacterized protein LOC126742936 [Anthonomus grandis grandis]